MGKKKITIDTNNLISALGWEGKSRELILKVIDNKYELIISLKQISELKKVMDYPKFKFSEEQKKKFLKILFEISNIIDTKLKLNIVKEDPDDDIHLECGVEGKADCIISGDNHLLKIKKFRNIKIMNVNDFLKSTL